MQQTDTSKSNQSTTSTEITPDTETTPTTETPTRPEAPRATRQWKCPTQEPQFSTSTGLSDDVDTLPESEERVFHAVYTGIGEKLEVELLDQVPAAESKFEFGHAVIDHPDWDEPRKALLSNLAIEIVDDKPSDEPDSVWWSE